ncbi:MAG: ABC transporter, partial [Variovorax sp.]|nr:ABC transporter [Variovorax sp.]
VADFDGDLDDYQRYLFEEAKRQREEAKVATREAAVAVKPIVAAPARVDQTKPIRKELAQVDEKLATAGAEKTSLEAKMAKQGKAADMADAGKRLKAVNEEITKLEERWLSLSDQLEGLVA